MPYEKVRIKMQMPIGMTREQVTKRWPGALALLPSGIDRLSLGQEGELWAGRGAQECTWYEDEGRWSRMVEIRNHPTASDRDFLASLDRQLADAVTFLPPAMRASFHAQMGALIKLAQYASDRAEDPNSHLDSIRVGIAAWRSERDRIRQRTGG